MHARVFGNGYGLDEQAKTVFQFSRKGVEPDPGPTRIARAVRPGPYHGRHGRHGPGPGPGDRGHRRPEHRGRQPAEREQLQGNGAVMSVGLGQGVHQRVSAVARRRVRRGDRGRIKSVPATTDEPDLIVGVLCGQVRRGRAAGGRGGGRQLRSAVAQLQRGAHQRAERLRAVLAVAVAQRVRSERARRRHVRGALRHVHGLGGCGARTRRTRVHRGRGRAPLGRQVRRGRLRQDASARVQRGRERSRPGHRVRGIARVRGPRLLGMHARAAQLEPHASRPQGLPRLDRAALGVRVCANRMRTAVD